MDDDHYYSAASRFGTPRVSIGRHSEAYDAAAALPADVALIRREYAAKADPLYRPARQRPLRTRVAQMPNTGMQVGGMQSVFKRLGVENVFDSMFN